MDITVQELKERLDKGEQLNLIDVRESNEYEADNIGAKLIPLGDLPYELDQLDGLQDEEVKYTAGRVPAAHGRSNCSKKTASPTSGM